MTDHLDAIFQRQYAMQRRYGYDLVALTPAERVTYLKDNNQAAIAELVEALQEISWKPWATGEPWINREALVRELVDVLCFLVNQFLALGATPSTVDRFHAAKVEVNERRRLDGYTGRDKCPSCGRAPDEPGADEAQPDAVLSDT